jgi:UPF0755 protein
MAGTNGKRKVARKKRGIWGITIVIGLLVIGIVFFWGYRKIFKPNVHIENEGGTVYLYLHTGSTFEQVLSSLTANKYLCDVKSFEWMAVKMNYPTHIKPGRYKISDGMTNRQLLNKLRSGNQEPVKVIFNTLRFKHELASVVGKQIEADSMKMVQLLNDEIFLDKLGLNKQTVPAIFIPNTYEMYWNTSAEQFIKKMYKEYQRFWNEKRQKQCKSMGLSPVEVSILASIVEEETQKKSERPIIAGVYVNRLNKGMALQADPTVKFAWGDFSIKRIYEKYMQIDSPYNTYKYAGLPPGPICIPSISAIEAVLNYQRHEYIYFCAKDDFSGYHNFARTMEQHNQNALKYRRALSRAGIRR